MKCFSVLLFKMFTTAVRFQKIYCTSFDRKRWHNHNKFENAVLFVEFKNSFGVSISFARAGFHHNVYDVTFWLWFFFYTISFLTIENIVKILTKGQNFIIKHIALLLNLVVNRIDILFIYFCNRM